MTPHLPLGHLPLAAAMRIQEGLLNVVSILLLSMLAGMLIYSTWAVFRLARSQPVLPRPPFVRLQPAAWGPGTIITIIALYLVTSQVASLACRDWLGNRVEEALKAYRGNPVEKKEVEVPPTSDAATGEAKDKASPPSDTAAAARDLMTLNACHMVLFLSVFPWFFRKSSRVDLQALGLSARRWAEQIQAGVVAALIATPAVYFVQFMAVHVFSPESHPVEKMMKDHFSPSTAILAFISAVMLAPIAEETLFRGVLQGWLWRVFRNPFKPIDELATNDLNEVCPPAVVLTSALFAALHIAQWPAPIPLFFFAMIVGLVYQRTGSLLTAITMHAVFNGFSTLMMLVQQLGADLHKVEDAVPAPAATIWKLLSSIMEVLG